jgi:hypothetical protein
VSWWAIHSAVGLLVTLSDISRRRWCLRMTQTNSNLKPIVGTISKSIAAMPAAWSWRKVFQVCDRPRPLFAMYLATVDCATSIPSFSSSPWMRGAHQSRFARLISRIRRRISAGILGRPPRSAPTCGGRRGRWRYTESVAKMSSSKPAIVISSHSRSRQRSDPGPSIWATVLPSQIPPWEGRTRLARLPVLTL